MIQERDGSVPPPAETFEEDCLAQEIAKAEAKARSIAKHDGIPSEWIETVLAKLRGKNASRA